MGVTVVPGVSTGGGPYLFFVISRALPGRPGEPILRHLAGSSTSRKSHLAGNTSAPLLVANLNIFAFDFIARQKVHGQTLNLFIVEQLPVISPGNYDRRFGDRNARDLIRDHVLRLTYSAYDMASFARDLGYDGQPFIWNAEQRRHLRARLDALYFHLYGLSREDAAYVLDTFPSSAVRMKPSSATTAHATSASAT